MSRVLSVTRDENLVSALKEDFKNNSYTLLFSESFDEANALIKDNDIVVAVVDYEIQGADCLKLCEELLTANPDVGIILAFNHSDTKDILAIYNKCNIYGLVCKGFSEYKDLSIMINSFVSEYYRFRNSDGSDTDYKRLFDLYLKPMREMSSILNERLSGYSNIIYVFRKSFGFVLDSSEVALNAIDSFVDRVLNDYINIFMTKEPDLDAYFDRICKNCNKVDNKKFFKLEGNIDGVSPDCKCNILFVINVLSTCFEVFYPHYRGKISIVQNKEYIEINSVYEVRKNKEIEGLYKPIMSVVNNIFIGYSNGVKNGVKDNIIQYKILFNI